MPITIGQMRNSWFPQRTAEYVTDTQMKELKTKNISAERDFQFGVPDPDEVKAREAQAQSLPTRTVEVEKLTVPSACLSLICCILTWPPSRNAPSTFSLPCYRLSWNSPDKLTKLPLHRPSRRPLRRTVISPALLQTFSLHKLPPSQLQPLLPRQSSDLFLPATSPTGS